jgi:hypothetical protein
MFLAIDYCLMRPGVWIVVLVETQCHSGQRSDGHEHCNLLILTSFGTNRTMHYSKHLNRTDMQTMLICMRKFYVGVKTRY